MTILITYAVCDVTAVIFQALSFVKGPQSIMSCLYIIYQASYIATSPCGKFHFTLKLPRLQWSLHLLSVIALQLKQIATSTLGLGLLIMWHC